jgi:hypothetical protein
MMMRGHGLRGFTSEVEKAAHGTGTRPLPVTEQEREAVDRMR